jgi:hypothetical protein
MSDMQATDLPDKQIDDLPHAASLDGSEKIEIKKGTGAGSSQYATAQELFDAAYAGSRFAVNIGDGTAATFTVAHGLGTRDVQVEVYRNAAPYDTGIVDVARPDVDNVVIGPFATAPGVNGFRVLIRAI